ncbi:RNA-binding domain-containing protein [Catonella massiliensis]|uniref:DNA binding domain-containing protein n=1 Tax=Catonella massiliensis TaxID=2799636 RepID=A0ABS1J455_9FIRM|nr:RNA-binding domain-containing protein [Catonella massiliensis]MBK5898709.1 putative DNA binding domain-containing protein [Catonella massiliensis]
MSGLFDLSNFNKYKEDNCLEVKKAESGLPISLWESYSSFANSNGGVIILGVGERQDGSWYTTGLRNVDKLKRNFWNIIHDTKKVSINLLSDKNVESYEVDGDLVLVINVPRAKREQKPVYINNDLFGGCYRRDWEGDYHCSKAEIKGMLRDAADETEDMKIVEQFDVSVIDTESLKGFRNHHKSYRPEHVFNNLPWEEYLERIGAAGYGEDGKLHPTTAGLLMFGEEYHIVREFPEYFLDYREMLDPTIRWTDRLQSSSGDWSGNVFDFFFRVNSKIAKDIKKPFKLEGITRIDDTPVHKAVREALVNCLVNTDYFLPCGVVIKKEEDKLVMENPGSIRTGKKQMLRGGISDPRNKILMKMFNMIGIGERAGSGIPDIYNVWENEGWAVPVVEESYNPDRTRLSLEFAKKQAIKTNDKKQTIKTNDKKQTSKTEIHREKIRKYLAFNKLASAKELAIIIELSAERTRVILSKMEDIIPVGENRNRMYKLKNE